MKQRILTQLTNYLGDTRTDLFMILKRQDVRCAFKINTIRAGIPQYYSEIRTTYDHIPLGPYYDLMKNEQ